MTDLDALSGLLASLSGGRASAPRVKDGTLTLVLDVTGLGVEERDEMASNIRTAMLARDDVQDVRIAMTAEKRSCRECIRKWHKMQPGKELSQVQQDYLVDVIMTWIQKEIEGQEHKI